MRTPPRIIGGVEVLRYSPIDERHGPSRRCRHEVAGRVMGPAAGLAICQSLDESGFYLFGCDQEWNSVTDTWHQTLEDAMHQAEFEYQGVTATWQEPR